jgi:mono/diheme cytochrome c family protein
MEIKPTAFNEPGYLASRKDGQLYWISLEGSEGTDMEPFGPGTDANYSEEELWQVITYIRSSFTN